MQLTFCFVSHNFPNMKSIQTKPSPLRARRIERGMTLAKMAAEVGATKASLSKIESGTQRPRVDLLRKLMAVTGLAADQIDQSLSGLMNGASPAE